MRCASWVTTGVGPVERRRDGILAGDGQGQQIQPGQVDRKETVTLRQKAFAVEGILPAMNSHHQLLIFSALAIFMWGLWGFFGKLALERDMAPTTLFLIPLTSTYPIVSVFLSCVILNEKPSPTQWIGIFLVVAGSVLLLSGTADHVSSQ